MKSILSALAVLGVTNAISDFGGNPNHNAPYFFREINTYDYDHDAESDYHALSDYDDASDSASIVESSSLYEGGCSVSSQALMCNGGGDSYLGSLDFFDSEEDFSDDEDDDEDDGHSSMLSNASVRRSRVLVGGPSGPSQSTGDSNTIQSMQEATTYIESEVQLSQKASLTHTPLAFLSRRR